MPTAHRLDGGREIASGEQDLFERLSVAPRWANVSRRKGVEEVLFIAPARAF
jgi:hypothetical protein